MPRPGSLARRCSLIVLRILSGHRARRRIWRRAIYVASMPGPPGAAPRRAGIQLRRRSACWPAPPSSSSPATRSGEEAFAAWGWRVPLLCFGRAPAVSVWMRARLAESRISRKLREEGERPEGRRFAKRSANGGTSGRSSSPLRDHVRAGRSRTSLSSTAGLPRQVARRPAGDEAHRGDRDDGRQRARLYALLRLAERPRRPQVRDGWRNGACAGPHPALTWDRRRREPGMVEAQTGDAVFVVTNPSTCAVQLILSARRSSSARATSPKYSVTKGISFISRPSTDAATREPSSAPNRTPIAQRRGLAGPELKALKAKTAEALSAELHAAGYPNSADPAQANMRLRRSSSCCCSSSRRPCSTARRPPRWSRCSRPDRYTAMSFLMMFGTGGVVVLFLSPASRSSRSPASTWSRQLRRSSPAFRRSSRCLFLGGDRRAAPGGDMIENAVPTDSVDVDSLSASARTRPIGKSSCGRRRSLAPVTPPAFPDL